MSGRNFFFPFFEIPNLAVRLVALLSSTRLATIHRSLLRKNDLATARRKPLPAAAALLLWRRRLRCGNENALETWRTRVRREGGIDYFRSPSGLDDKPLTGR